MTLLPVVGRELRVASRRPWNYWARTVSAAVAVAVCAWMLLLERGTTMGALGKSLFAVTSFLSFAYALLAGLVFSADSLAGERREGTLGLLFLTDLRGHDVLLGKLAASSLACVFQLGAALPVIAMSMLLGSVSIGEYLRMILVLLSTLLLSLSLGMLASTFSADGKRAAAAALGLVVLACGAVPAFGGLGVWISFKLGGTPEVAQALYLEFCSWASPVPLYWWAFDTGIGGAGQRFWQALAFVAVAAIAALVWGSIRLPHLWQVKEPKAAGKGLSGRIEARRWPTAAARDGFRRRLLEEGPMVWLAARRWTGAWFVWLFLAIVAVVYLAIGAEVGGSWFEAAPFLSVSILVHTALKVWIASEAPRQFLDDRRSGAMELLLSTSLGVDEIVAGRLRAVRRQFELPCLAVLLFDAAFLVAGAGSSHGADAEWVLMWLARMTLLVLDGYALAWTGAWIGLSTRGSRTTLPTLFRIVVLPWLASFGGATVLALASWGAGAGPGFGAIIFVWWLLCAGVDVAWIARSRARMLAEFREHGRTRPGEKKSAAA